MKIVAIESAGSTGAPYCSDAELSARLSGAAAPATAIRPDHEEWFARERAYQREMAERFQTLREAPVDLKIAFHEERRWWNGAWSTYDRMREIGVKGKRILVVGCGFGEDAIRLALMGGEVEAIDISPDMIEICRERAARIPGCQVNFRTLPVEYLDYPDDHFDMVVCLLVMHHVDIPVSMEHLRRVAKPDGFFICQEPYMYGPLQKIRHSRFVEQQIWKRLVPIIYRRSEFPLSEDERKLDQKDLAQLLRFMDKHDLRVDFYNGISGRLTPEGTFIDKIDRLAHLAFPPLAKLISGLFVITGRFKK
jgi:ubiquinone/menaquinone biosynthesis C-methylase UbiE